MKRVLLKNSRGFTLIEILIVVVIIGILAAIAIPLFTAQTDNARIAEIRQNLSNVRQAAAMWDGQHGSLRTGGGTTGIATIADLQTVVQLGGTAAGSALTLGDFTYTLAGLTATGQGCTIAVTAAGAVVPIPVGAPTLRNVGDSVVAETNQT